jgi:CheY-like chemotaxis protein
MDFKPTRKAKVLAVDDKRANLITLEAVLGSAYDVVFANSGPEAIALLESDKAVDLILMDVQMPEMDGFEAARRIKGMPGFQDVPIIFVTAVYDEDPFIKRGYEVGGIDYFTKPFDPDILKMKVAIYSSFRLKADLLRERETQLRASEELLKVGRDLSAVLEGLDVGVLIADGDGSICQTTDTAARILTSFESFSAERYGEILQWWEADGRVLKGAPLAQALQAGETSHRVRTEVRCVDGSQRVILTSAAPLRGLDGKIIGAVLVIQDLTRARKIEKDLEQRVMNLVSLGVELEDGHH